MKSKRYRFTLSGFWLFTGIYGICAFFELDLLPADLWIKSALDPIYRLMFGGG
ncbi:hypothetical protein GKZ89_06105 [Bacillus mangrovi]|uniref:Uncharacterized protein n=1 Tax=Metabacillus mangrovi TaxID=1491830 RepID=A0A7X2V4F7_9BACI|nr:hypothetical protein [Metabacillus mangrovi]MTH52978.1 hypothetical protein [Metabacillus mangrovi]